ncbi:hypothetical protein KJ810_02595 [Patescibacteria group bacterium]|nr:hypothetical protein [Patescibacteria group bacterium]
MSSPKIEAGTKIWRMVMFSKLDLPHLFSSQFPTNGDGHALFRANVGTNVFSTQLMAYSACQQGTLCVCPEPIPGNFTHFEVVEVGQGENPTVVKPVAGDSAEHLRQFNPPERCRLE